MRIHYSTKIANVNVYDLPIGIVYRIKPYLVQWAISYPTYTYDSITRGSRTSFRLARYDAADVFELGHRYVYEGNPILNDIQVIGRRNAT